MTLFIVDDEKKTRENLCKLIQWKENGITLLGSAQNGKEALNFLLNQPADLVITDIRMPLIDGLTLISALRKSGQKSKFIVLSGYDNFEYAKQAIQFGVSEYILKPCSRKEILSTVLKMKKEFEAEESLNYQREQVLIQMESERPFLIGKYLYKLLQGMESYTDLKEKLEFLNVSLDYPQFTVLLAVSPSSVFVQGQKSQIITPGLMEYISAIQFEKIDYELITVEETFIFLLKHREKLDPQTLHEKFFCIFQKLENQFHVKLVVGIGNSYSNINSIKQSYQEAMTTVDQIIFSPSSTCLFFSEAPPVFPSASYPFSCEREILTSIKQGNCAQTENAFQSFIISFSNKQISGSQALRQLSILKSALLRLMIELNLTVTEPNAENLNNQESSLMSLLYKSQIEVRQLISELLRKIQSRKSKNPVISFVLEHIEQNYYQELSREKLAEKAFVSPSYLSTLFHQEMGMNFSDYLNRVRIRNACKKLADSSCKIYEIALNVGFHDEKYFSQVFKKIEGLSPVEYRAIINKNR